MNTPNNLEWLDEVLEQMKDNIFDIRHDIELPEPMQIVDVHEHCVEIVRIAKQTIATKLSEAEQKGYGALYQFLISRLDVKTGRISLSSKQLAKFHAEYIATLTNDKEQE